MKSQKNVDIVLVIIYAASFMYTCFSAPQNGPDKFLLFHIYWYTFLKRQKENNILHNHSENTKLLSHVWVVFFGFKFEQRCVDVGLNKHSRTSYSIFGP